MSTPKDGWMLMQETKNGDWLVFASDQKSRVLREFLFYGRPRGWFVVSLSGEKLKL